MPKGTEVDFEGLFKELGLDNKKDQDPKKTDFNKVNGTLAVTDGVICVKYPRNFGKYPTIVPGKHLRIFINKQEIFKPSVIAQDDEIEFEVVSISPETAFNIEVSADNLKAYLIIRRYNGSQFCLQDQEPITDLILNGVFEKEILAEGPSVQAVLNLLQQKQIIYGINEALIYEVVHNTSEGEQRVEIASGEPVVNGENSKIVYKFMEKETKELEHTNPYQKKVLCSVAPGEVLAVKIPAKEGKVGIDVFGKEIMPTLPKEAIFQIGDGVQLIGQNTMAIANLAGRPYLVGRTLMVLPCYVLNQNVNVEIGNFEFNGDIIINGDVLDGFKVKASGNIEVNGGVLNAELEAGGSIVVTKSVVGSQLIAGRSNSVLRKLKIAFQELIDLLKQLLSTASQVQKAEAFKSADLDNGQGRLILVLIQSRFRRIPELLNEMVSLGVQNPVVVEDKLRAILEGLYKKFSHYGPLEIKETKEIIFIYDAICKINKSINPIIFISADISAYFAQKSFLSASGNIVITGNGCISTELEAGQNIIVEGSPGVVRGGKLNAGHDIKVNVIGSTAIVKVFAELSGDGILEAKLVHPTLVIKHKNEVLIIEEDSRFVKAFTNKNGLQIEKLKAF